MPDSQQFECGWGRPRGQPGEQERDHHETTQYPRDTITSGALLHCKELANTQDSHQGGSINLPRDSQTSSSVLQSQSSDTSQELLTTNPSARTSKHATHRAKRGRRFACWFCRRYGLAGSNGAACEGKGFVTLHRAKEHLQRRHAPDHECPRCHESFASADAVDQHISSAVACEPRTTSTTNQGNTLTSRQIGDLKRKRKPNTSESDEWNRIYKLLFPDQTIIPSAYVGDADDECGVNPYFQDYIRNELSDELHNSFDNATAHQLRDSDFKAVKIREAVDQVTTRYKRQCSKTYNNAGSFQEDATGSAHQFLLTDEFFFQNLDSTIASCVNADENLLLISQEDPNLNGKPPDDSISKTSSFEPHFSEEFDFVALPDFDDSIVDQGLATTFSPDLPFCGL